MKRADYEKLETPCCGRKPVVYMRTRHSFCTRCCRAYSLETGEQIANWAWLATSDGLTPKYPDGDYTKLPARGSQDG